jgi:uncharacterized OB-fold protein
MSGIADWTTGGKALAYSRCRACRSVRYFRRSFCPHCGSPEIEGQAASGRGTVYAVTTVVRAPSTELRASAPYHIALVDAEEGFRFMTHAAEGLAIGDAVSTTFRPFGERIVPFVEPERS